MRGRILKITLAIVLAACLTWVGYETARLVRETKAMISETRRAAKSVADYVELQTKVLSSEKNQKAIESGLQTLAVYNATGKLLNKSVLPELKNTLIEARAATAAVREASVSLDVLIRNTDRSLNDDLLPVFVETASTFHVGIDKLNRAIEDVASRGVLTLDDLHAIMSDPSWKTALSAIAESSMNIESATASVEDAMKRAPDITKSLQEIASTSSKYRKAVLLSQILSAVARAFF